MKKKVERVEIVHGEDGIIILAAAYLLEGEANCRFLYEPKAADVPACGDMVEVNT